MGGEDGFLPDAAEVDGSMCRDFLRNVCTRGNKCKFKHRPRKRELAMPLPHFEELFNELRGFNSYRISREM